MNQIRPISETDLHAYVDLALDASRQAEVEAYLASHPDVAQRVQGYMSQRKMLRDIFDPIAQEPIPAELSLARIVETARRPRLNGWRSVAAAALLLTAGAAAGWFGHGLSPGTSSGIAALAEEASDNYATYGSDRTRPVEIKAADSAELVKWVSERLRHSISAPDLTASGYRFMGGRLVATPHGPAGLFMYDDDRSTRLVMLVRPMAAEKDTPMSQQGNGGVAGFAWAQNSIGYSLVGATSPEILHPLADEIRKQSAKNI
ncbi:Transmembrane transcriptional regulator (anti-sigma factor RsiW) [Rhizobiales bacterium GAS191]|nr:Transmembrane transcriptional regulator (anti-sigma factor RsiW) [Rhizobiales bacterium GAS191]